MHRSHPIHRRYYAEDLVRLRRAGERRRYAASQRRGRIDPNPHQIDAVMFALRRIPEGGCILADEVGLGKTIEAGLVIAQLLAEGASRILIVVPRPLLGQWQQELLDLFGIDAIELGSDSRSLEGPGVFIAGREQAGSERGFSLLSAVPPFDLCVVDEAHEVFAGIHRRYDRYGVYKEDGTEARTAHRVRKLFGATPVLLLTATPIQNSLAELWGLVQYVDPTGTLLGSLPTFIGLFCANGDPRRLAPEQADDLRRRLAAVVKRTLRRQAQEFLDRPFVGRRAQLFEYSMSDEERALYDDVTSYLLRADSFAFGGRSRHLLLLGFHRRMASSIAALADSLERVAARLRRLAEESSEPASEAEKDRAGELADLEEDDAFVTEQENEEDDGASDGQPVDEPIDPVRLKAETELVEGFVRRARALPHDSKAESLVKAVEMVMARPERRKVVIFTESLTTQEYLRSLLLEQTKLQDQDITLFRGVNDSPRAREALLDWRTSAHGGAAEPSVAVATRLSLVHEFKTCSKVFISTEAGAKGLNLQFCDTIINYDLPWNPQRIEQRIGRCHRYGQQHDVTVVNFVAQDNEAQRLTMEILSTKLDLFGEVLDMSDVVLHTPRSDRSDELASALGADFEAQLGRIWDRSRSVQEVEEELRQLRESLEERRRELEDVRERTIGLIENRLDESVRRVFQGIEAELPVTLLELDAELERVVVAYLEAEQIPFRWQEDGEARLLDVGPSADLPAELGSNVRVKIGGSRGDTDVPSLHSAHPLVEAAVAEARRATHRSFRVVFQLQDDSAAALTSRRGCRGRLALSGIAHSGFEREERLQATAVFEDEGVLRPAEAALELLQLPCNDVEAFSDPLRVSTDDLEEVVSEEIFHDQSALGVADQEDFERAIDQLDQFMEDRVLLLRRALSSCLKRLRAAEQTRDRALGPDARSKAETRVRHLQAEASELELQLKLCAAREDDEYRRWRDHAHARRYALPKVERLFEVEFVLE